MERIQQSLNGVWDYRIGEGAWTSRTVPFSALPVGRSACRRQFDAQGGFDRAFLVLEGITYAAEVTLNGQPLGQMLPYCEYRFEITDLLKPTANRLQVDLQDIDPVFGPSEGWENYGGLIRSVYVEYTASSLLTDVVWTAELSDDFTAASCRVRVETDGPADAVTCRLTDADGTVCAEGAAAEGVFTFAVTHPRLWSPDTPNLYTLTTTLWVNGQPMDTDCRQVGFKSLVIRGKRFYLNGVPTFLLGVCRHDMWGDQGHTLTDEQIEEDLRLIKAQGVNYVRLVHYPHDKRVLQAADRLGLLVSEEPGLWWSDMHNQQICDDSLEVLRRTVIRDRSHVSVAFWLAFNECIFTAEFIRDSARVCREADPTRMVSGANCMDIPMTRQYFTENGFDFYTLHPYADNTDRMWHGVRELTDKPVVFTEWGGYPVWKNDDLFERFIRDMVRMWKNPEDQPVLAGAALWCWADIYEFSRSGPACRDGILCEGLTDLWRRPHSHFPVFAAAFGELYREPDPEYALTVEAAVPAGRYRPLSLCPAETGYDEAASYEQTRTLWQQPVSRYYYAQKQTRHITVGPLLPEPVEHLGDLPVRCRRTPYTVNREPLTLTVEDTFTALWVVGNVSLPYGYPVSGEYGAPAAEYVLQYADGTEETVPVRNGLELTTAFTVLGPSRIDPVAAHAPRALSFRYDKDREAYIANLFRIPTRPQPLRTVTLRVSDPQYSVLLYGITGEY